MTGFFAPVRWLIFNRFYRKTVNLATFMTSNPKPPYHETFIYPFQRNLVHAYGLQQQQ